MGIELRSYDELHDWGSKLVISSRVTRAKNAREGVTVVSGGQW